MFHHRSSAFAPSVSAIQHHLRGVEKELEKVGRVAGRRTSAAALAASDQIGETVSSFLGDLLDRFYKTRSLAADQASRYGNEALKIGARAGNDAIERVAAEVENRPLLVLGVAVGIGILIGAAVLRR